MGFILFGYTLWGGVAKFSPQVCGLSPLVEGTQPTGIPHVDVNEARGGVQTLCPVHHLTHKQATCIGGHIESVWEGLVVGEGVGERAQQGTNFGQWHLGHCVRNWSSIKEQKHAKV